MRTRRECTTPEVRANRCEKLPDCVQRRPSARKLKNMKFTMEFEPTTIEHLGLKLYVSLPPVIGELVSNAWDADAENVWVTLPTGSITEKSEIVVKDDGMGMDETAVQEAYLRIGRNCREVLGRETTK